MKTKEQIRIVIPADLRFSNTIRNFVGDLLKVVDVQDLWVNRMILVMDELFMNAVKYGSNSIEDNVFVTVDFLEDEVVFYIEDMGTGVKKVAPEDLHQIIATNRDDPSLAKTSGRGLSMIVSNWTNGYAIEQSDKGGIKITVRKKLADIKSKPQDVQQVSLESMPDVIVVNFSEKIDVHDSEMEKNLIHQVESMEKNLCIFDLHHLDYVNSVFIGLLAKLFNIVSKKQGKVVIINISDTIKDALKLVGLTDIIPVVENLEEARNVLMGS